MIYLLLLLWVLGLCYLNATNRINNKMFVWMAFFAMTIVVGLRGSTVGEDTATYLEIAEAAKNMRWKDILVDYPNTVWRHVSYGIYGDDFSKIETGYLLFNKVVISLFGTAQSVLFISALITHVFIAKFVLNNAETKKEVTWGVIVFLCESIFFTEFNAVRQIMALAIAIQSFYQFRISNYKKGMLFIFLAWNIHQTAAIYLVLIPIIILSNKGKYLKRFLTGCAALVAFFPVITNILIRILPQRYVTYLQRNIWASSVGGTAILWLIIIFCIFVMLHVGTNSHYDKMLIMTMALYLAIEGMALTFTALGRMAMYFRVFELMFFSRSIKYYKGKSRLLFSMGLLALLIAAYYNYATMPPRAYSFCFA